MKKTLLTLVLLAAVLPLGAVPASPKPFRYTQPDGSVITLLRHGDEFYHWTTSAGRKVYKDADGFYRPVADTRAFDLAARARAAELRNLQRQIVPFSGNTGTRRCPVILVEFSDRHFTVKNPADAFYRQLNETGFSGNGATGSVAQYFYENSSGAFSPVFDVIGPVRVSGKMADYGGNGSDGGDKNAPGCFAEACAIAHESGLVDFSRYDSDADGYVDNMFFYYAGFNEAEGSDTNPNDDTIWPHAWSLAWYGDTGIVYDGVRLGSYACGSELNGATGNSMCGIGTFCHEFGHVLGLPDFYDTNGEEEGTASTLEAFSLMDSGCYNNGGHTPPHLNALERVLLGWMELPEEWGAGRHNLGAIQDNVAGRIPTGNPEEYYLLEVRNGKYWDSKIFYSYTDGSPVSACAEGLIVYHVDRSSNKVGESTAAKRWHDGYDVNSNGEHPCFTLIPADDDYQWALDKVPFPGASRVKKLSGLDSWNGAESGFSLSGITYSGGTVNLTVEKESALRISGTVSDSDGRPITGAEVALSSGEAAKTVPDQSVKTGSDGHYSFVVPGAGTYTVRVSAGGYQSRIKTLKLGTANAGLGFTMLRYTETRTDYLRKYGSLYGPLGFGDELPQGSGYAVAVRFSTADLSDYAGMDITALEFMLELDSADEVYAFVDFGKEREFLRKVDSPVLKSEGDKMNKVDLSDAGLSVPADKEVLIGYMVNGFRSSSGYYIPVDYPALDDSGLCCLYSNGSFTTDVPSNWFALEDGYGSFFAPMIRAEVQTPAPGELLGYGVHSIKAAFSYQRGAVLSLELGGDTGDDPDSVEWFYDGAPVTVVHFTQAGRHTLTAVLHYADGREETIEQVITVN